ncbi:sodium-dependent nutrient amino acid transporter 1-like [Littorina saxatilis]|uniref:Transporter n=1 Tax=Littorina saxatilis TaxID=31220 RepID=A0AAN9AV65_9CAEN
MTSSSKTDADVSSHLASARYTKEYDDLPEHTVVRERFSTQKQAFFTFLGYTVGPGNVWRFPYLVLKNGGAVFVLMYVLIVALIGVPMLFMEFSLGQFSGKDHIKVWDLNPAFRGVGFSMSFVGLLMTFQFQIFMAHCLLFAVTSFSHTFPWNKCEADWKGCFDTYADLKDIIRCNKTSVKGDNCLCVQPTYVPDDCVEKNNVAAEFYYRFTLLGEGKPSYGTPSWRIVLLLMVSWTLTTVCTFRGIRTTNKVIYAIVIVPYVALVVLMTIAASQEGAGTGVDFLFTNFNWGRLLSINTWMDAVGHTFLSLSSNTGLVYVLGSYYVFETMPHINVIAAATMDTLTSLVASAVVFLTLGQAAYQAGPGFSIEDIVKSDLNLAFVAYPASLLSLPIHHVWSFIFFVMLYVLALDSMFGLLEVTMTYLQDDFRAVRRRTVLCRVIFSAFCFLVDVFLATPGGYDVMMTFDAYGISICLPFIGLVEIVAIMWAYGFQKWVDDLEYMTGIQVPFVPGLFFLYVIFIPVFLFSLFVVTLVKFDPPRASHLNRDLGIVCAILILLPIPLWLILHTWSICRRKRTKKFTFAMWIKRMVRPSRRWGPNDGSNTLRDVDSVFADIFPALRSRRVRRRESKEKKFALSVDDFEKQVETFYGSSNKVDSCTGAAGAGDSRESKRTSFNLSSTPNTSSSKPGTEESKDMQESRLAVQQKNQLVQGSSNSIKEEEEQKEEEQKEKKDV